MVISEKKIGIRQRQSKAILKLKVIVFFLAINIEHDNGNSHFSKNLMWILRRKKPVKPTLFPIKASWTIFI